MRAGRRDLQRAARHGLAAHVGEIFRLLGERVGFGRRRARQRLAAQPCDGLVQVLRRVHVETLHERRLRCGLRSAHELRAAGTPEALRQRQRAARAAERTVQRHWEKARLLLRRTLDEVA